MFSVSYRDGLRCRVRIHVQPDRRIVVDAPPQTPLPEIKQALLKRARWVSRQLSKLEVAHRHALSRQYVSGETHWYMGKRYLLKVRVSNRSTASTKLKAGRLIVTVRARNPALVQAALNEGYRARALDMFDRRLEALYPELRWVSRMPEWQLRPMKKQWGSCSPRGRLSLNPMLIKAPRTCIDYVITHELCHLRHHNHSDQYYRLLTRQLPNWRVTKQRLDDLAEQILK